MHPPPPISIHLHPAPSTSTKLILTSTQLQSPPPSSFQSPSGSLQHPQQYLDQNIARNWAISPNLGRKIKSCPFWLKISTHGILEVLIPNPDWANFGPKNQNCSFCLKIVTHSISRMLIPNPDLDFWNFDPKIHFWSNLGPKSQRCWKLAHMVSWKCRFRIRTWLLKFWPQNSFLGKFCPKKSKLLILIENWHTWYIEDADSYSFFFLSILNIYTCKHKIYNHLQKFTEIYNYSDNSFLNYQPLIHFWANLGWKSQTCLFCLKIGTQAHTHAVSRRCWFLFRY